MRVLGLGVRGEGPRFSACGVRIRLGLGLDALGLVRVRRARRGS